MKNKVSDKERLNHISDAIHSIEDFSLGINYDTYNKDFKLRLALVKLFEIIGEASNGITSETQIKFSDVEWTILKNIRNILVHEYFGIDYDIIWASIKNNIPELKIKINTVLKELS